MSYILNTSSIKKRRSLFYILFSAIAVSILYSCEKNVTVDIPVAEEQIVVEGWIEIGQPAFVIISRTLPFFGEINTNDLVQNTVQGATVIISDGSMTDTLDQIPGYGIYTSTQMVGVARSTYYLTVLAEGKTLKSRTTIPEPLPLDSVWWKVDGNRDSLGFAWAHMTDPDTLGNCYQFKSQRINHYTYGENVGEIKDSTFIAPPGAVFEDKFINAKSFDFSFARGNFPFSDKEDDEGEEQYFFKRGDTIIVKFSAIDRHTFEFWRTEQAQVDNNGNPFGTPAPVSSNIEGGLGVWGGYAPTFDTIIAH